MRIYRDQRRFHHVTTYTNGLSSPLSLVRAAVSDDERQSRSQQQLAFSVVAAAILNLYHDDGPRKHFYVLLEHGELLLERLLALALAGGVA